MEQEIKHQTCSTCGEEKPLTKEHFAWRTDRNSFRKQCKECRNRRNRKNRAENREKYNKMCRDYYHKKKEENPNYRSEGRKKYYENNKEWLNKLNQEWYKENKERHQKLVLDWKNKKYKEDPFYKMMDRMRTRVKNGITNKWDYTLKILGCENWETFINHIEKQFTDGMTWDNQGEWHYDHYYPVSLIQTEEDLYIFNHYTNFQPLWAKDNLSKKDKVPDGFEEWYEMMKEKVL